MIFPNELNQTMSGITVHIYPSSVKATFLLLPVKKRTLNSWIYFHPEMDQQREICKSSTGPRLLLRRTV